MSEEEEWRVLKEFPDYAASSFGRIKRIRIDKRNHRLTNETLIPGLSETGYEQVCLVKEIGGSVTKRVNRIICAAFHGPSPEGCPHAAHNDGNKRNNAASNLRWATCVENESDKRVHGTAAIGERHWSKLKPERRAKGEGHGLAKLSAADIPKIRADTRFQRDIAADYGVTQRAIWSIKAGKTWGHIP